MIEEKFVSIDYEIWQNKYLPMEQVLKQTKAELAKEKESKTILIYASTRGYTSEYGYGRELLGSIDVGFNAGSLVNFDREVFDRYLNNLINIDRGYYNFVSKYQLDEWNAKVEKSKTDMEELFEKNQNLKSKIPWLIRWIFKIK